MFVCSLQFSDAVGSGDTSCEKTKSLKKKVTTSEVVNDLAYQKEQAEGGALCPDVNIERGLEGNDWQMVKDYMRSKVCTCLS